MVSNGGMQSSASLGIDGLAPPAMVGAGTVVMAIGGTTVGDMVWRDGREVVQSGGLAEDTALLGGTLEVASGGSANVLFGLTADGLYDSASMLVLDASTSFHGTIVGFGLGGKADQIDLRDIAFLPTSKKGQLSYNAASGTLTATDGVHTAVLQMSYMGRSEERRVGKECASMCRSRWSPYH